ncbi:MAG: RNA 2'-phosphotransferase [Hadesarchaea archaeon]|nr:RNA 2'-phosphotransferase [Hadesarchaea archaeon]
MTKNKTKISKTMAYLLRHDPSGMNISREGFVELSELLEKLKENWPKLSKEQIKKIVEEDPKGRYEIKDNQIRARYGHSINVNPTLTEAKENELYHGTTPKAAEKIMKEGLKSKGRQKVHLSKNISDAVQVGKRRENKPTILKIDSEKACESGVKIERASDKVFVTDHVPPEFISIESSEESQ